MVITKCGVGSLVCGLVASILLSSCDNGASSKKASLTGEHTVPKVASCASDDHPEPALQGQVPAAVRASGFGGYNCNLAPEGQYAGEGGGVGFASFNDDHGHYCAYYSSPIGTGTGTSVVDMTDPAKPVLMTTLKTPAMLNPGEAMRVNARRQLLVTAQAGGIGKMGGPGVDVYDISADCRDPKLLASTDVGTGTDGGVVAPIPVKGHDSNFSPDGLTFYIGDPYGKAYSVVDMTDPTKPKLIAQMDMSKAPLNGEWMNGGPHGISLSDDGNRAYITSVGFPKAAELSDPNAKVSEGFYVVDTSEVQARKPDPQMKVISYLTFKDGSTAMHTLSVKIGGKPYLIHVNEGGGGGMQGSPVPGGGTLQDACNAGLTPFPMARIVDISDETKPKLVSDLMLEIHDVKNCDKVLPDVVGGAIISYGSHICSVDNRENATALACAYMQSGMRVFDIRNPAAPKEIAYFNPQPVVAAKSSSQAAPGANVIDSGAVNACGSPAGFDFERKLLTTMCTRSGALVLKFENGVWPFPESTPAPGGVSYN